FALEHLTPWHSETTIFFFSRRRRHTRFSRDWSSDVCSSDLRHQILAGKRQAGRAMLFLQGELPAFRRLRLVGRTEQEEVRNGARSEERRVGKECWWRG